MSECGNVCTRNGSYVACGEKIEHLAPYVASAELCVEALRGRLAFVREGHVRHANHKTQFILANTLAEVGLSPKISAEEAEEGLGQASKLTGELADATDLPYWFVYHAKQLQAHLPLYTYLRNGEEPPMDEWKRTRAAVQKIFSSNTQVPDHFNQPKDHVSAPGHEPCYQQEKDRWEIDLKLAFAQLCFRFNVPVYLPPLRGFASGSQSADAFVRNSEKELYVPCKIFGREKGRCQRTDLPRMPLRLILTDIMQEAQRRTGYGVSNGSLTQTVDMLRTEAAGGWNLGIKGRMLDAMSQIIVRKIRDHKV